MKTSPFIVFGIVLTSLFLNSCTTKLYTSLDVLRPAKVTFAPDIKKLMIVNNTVKQPSDYGHKTELLYEKVKNVTVTTDSLSIFCLASLTEELNRKEFFSSLNLLPNSLNTSNDFFYVKYPAADTVKALCERYHVDAILSLDRIKVTDKTTEYMNGGENIYLADLVVNYETQWSIHHPKEPKFSATTFRDTVFWESESPQRRKAMNGLPNRTNALIDGALYVGQNTTKRLIPFWEKVDRYFFSNENKYMKQGIDSVYVKNWTSAIKSWENVLKKNFSNSNKAKAANNIAIAYEISGDIEKAIEYAELSLDYYGKSMSSDYESFMMVSNYLEELLQRKKEILILKKQLAE
ncbi:MAG: DUF6340 family protein [Paludibacter sp.]|nr:DUF6340 family protein [Paludibacter sp.]